MLARDLTVSNNCEQNERFLTFCLIFFGEGMTFVGCEIQLVFRNAFVFWISLYFPSCNVIYTFQYSTKRNALQSSMDMEQN